MNTGLTLDTRQWQRAMVAYQAATRKDCAAVLNKRAANVCLRTVEFLPHADKSVIKDLPKRTWWPKFVAKRIMGRGMTMTLHRKAKGANSYAGKTARTFTIRGHYTVAQARLVSRQLVARRVRGIGFLGSAPLKAGRSFGVGARMTGQQFRTMGIGVAATASALKAKLHMTWEGRNVAHGRDLVQKAMQAAMDFDTKDMMNEVRRRLSARGAQFSGVPQ